MTEPQRQPVPRSDAGELDTAVAFLTFARESVLKKTDGLNTSNCAASLWRPGPICWA